MSQFRFGFFSFRNQNHRKANGLEFRFSSISLFPSFFSATKQNAKKRNKWEDKNVENGPEVRLRFRPSPPSLALKFQISVCVLERERERERERENFELLNDGKLFIYRSSTEDLDEILWKNRNKILILWWCSNSNDTA